MLKSATLMRDVDESVGTRNPPLTAVKIPREQTRMKKEGDKNSNKKRTTNAVYERCQNEHLS